MAALVLIGLVVGLGAVAFVFSVKVTRAARLERLEIVRMPDEFLVIEELRVETDPWLKHNRISLKLTGLLRNPGDRACKAPRVLVELLDSKGRPMATGGSWAGIDPELEAGGSRRFETTEIVLTSSQAAEAGSVRVMSGGVATPPNQ